MLDVGIVLSQVRLLVQRLTTDSDGPSTEWLSAPDTLQPFELRMYRAGYERITSDLIIATFRNKLFVFLEKGNGLSSLY